MRKPLPDERRFPISDSPATLFAPTKGRKPRTGAQKLYVQFRNGYVCKWQYTADQLRWTDTGDDWDVVGVRIAKD